MVKKITYHRKNMYCSLKKTNQCTSISVSGKNEIQIKRIQVEWEFSLFKNNNTFSGTRKK